MNSKRIMYILVAVISVAVFVTIILVIKNIGKNTNQSVTLQFWGVYDDSSAFDSVVKNFKTLNPGIDVKYKLLTYDQYEQTLVNSLAAGSGPDILMIQSNWLSKHGDKLAPLPAIIPGLKQPLLTTQTFKSQFVDVTAQDLIYQSQIYALPLYVDTLAMYYNKDLFNSAGITRPPQTWDEVNTDVSLLTHFDGRGNITQSGAALGTAQNINRSTDLLMDMMIQSGVQMTADDHSGATFAAPVNGQHIGEQALQYYTDFANPKKQTYTWNDSQHYSVDAFTEGTVAMMFNYSHQSAIISSKAPRLNFSVAPMPQASMNDVRNFANYWAVAVSKTSAHIPEAWKFIAYLTSKDGASMYLDTTHRPSARRDLIDLQRSDPGLGVFAIQALTARSWFETDPAAIETIFATMIDDVNFNRASVPDALSQAESKVDVLMRQ